jgi:transposase
MTRPAGLAAGDQARLTVILDAFTAGLTLRWSSGAVGGHINRIKMLKRQIYGRANPDLLRLRVLLAD